jgi:hypothetical protein
MNNGEVVDKVPAPATALFLVTSDPAKAIVGITHQTRPISMAIAPKKL